MKIEFVEGIVCTRITGGLYGEPSLYTGWCMTSFVFQLCEDGEAWPSLASQVRIWDLDRLASGIQISQ